MKKVFVLLFIFFVYQVKVYAQNPDVDVHGKVVLSKGDAAQSANVFLLTATDSSIVKSAVTSEDGMFNFYNVDKGYYILSVSITGYQKYISAPFLINDSLSVPIITLSALASELGGVIVTATRPIIEQRFDKLIFNVNGNITAAGNSALEVLEKAPGVMVSQDGAISLGGRPGVLILIDGTRTHLSQSDLAAYLRGLPASAIDRIDLITNPSAQYEAEGTSGIIDIRLKKDDRMGYNGSVNMAVIYGTNISGNGSTNFNYRNKNLNIFGTLSKTYNRVEGKQITDRTFFINNQQYNGSIHTNNDREFKLNSNNVRVGADYFLNEKTIIGVIAMGSFVNDYVDFITRSDNYYLQDSTDFSIDRSLNSVRRNNAAFNFNIKHTIDSGGKEWNFDIDFAPFSSNSDLNLQADFYDKNSSPNRPFYYSKGDFNGNINVYSSRFDLKLPKVWGGNVQAGVRSSLVKSDNVLKFYDQSSGSPVLDESRSNRFLYDENINAIYGNYQLKKNNWSLQGGLRVENTNGKGKQVTNNYNFSRTYVQLFPNIYMGYDVSKNYSVGFSISRRIDRPSYNQLNPFRFYASPFGYSEGNPLLNPQLTYVAEISNTFYKRYIARLSYSITNDVISMTWGLDPDDIRISAQSPLNLSNTKSYRFSLTAPVRVRNWLTSFNNFVTAINSFEGQALNTQLDRSLPWVYISSNNTFRITKTFTAELNVGYRSATISGFQRMVAASAVAVGFGKQILAGKGNLRFNVTDIFQTSVGHGVTTLHNYELDVRQWNETRRANLSFSYNFGKSKVAATRNRTSSSEEERARATQ